MWNLLGFFLVILAGSLIMFFIIKSANKKTSSDTSQKEKSTNSTPAEKEKTAPAGNANPQKKQSVLSTIGKILGLIILFVIVIWFIGVGIRTVKSISNFFKPDTYSWVINTEKTHVVPISGEYGSNYYYANPHEGISFENSTVNFCVRNEVRERCGEKGKKLKDGFPGSDPNLTFQVKSSNGEDGYITIIYWEKIKNPK